MTLNSFALPLFSKPRVEPANNNQTKQTKLQKSTWEKVSAQTATPLCLHFN